MKNIFVVDSAFIDKSRVDSTIIVGSGRIKNEVF